MLICQSVCILVYLSQDQKQEYKNLGHGTYDTITNEKEFFEIGKKSDRVVCLFYIDTSFRWVKFKYTEST